MADFFSEVQKSIPSDTFGLFGITPENVQPDPYVIQQVDAWVAGQAEEPDLSKIWASPEPGLALGTAGAIGAKYGKNKQVADWVDRQRYKLGETMPSSEPKLKGRMGTMWSSGFYKGQQTAVKETLEGAGSEPNQQPTPEPAPQPTPRGGNQATDLIGWLAGQPIEVIQMYYEAGRINEDQYKEVLARKGVAQ